VILLYKVNDEYIQLMFQERENMAPIGERLRSEGFITEQDLEKALKRQRAEGGSSFSR
jgi:hypothetical protein